MRRSQEAQRLEELIEAALQIEQEDVVRAVRHPAALHQACELGRLVGLEVVIGKLNRYRWMGGIQELFWAASADDDVADRTARLLSVRLVHHVLRDSPEALAAIAAPLAQIRAIAQGQRRPFQDRRDPEYLRSRLGFPLRGVTKAWKKTLINLQLREVPYPDVLTHLVPYDDDTWWHRQILRQVRSFLMDAPAWDARVEMIGVTGASVLFRGGAVDEVTDPARLRQLIGLRHVLGTAALIRALRRVHWPRCAYELLLAATDDRQRAARGARDFAAACVALLPDPPAAVTDGLTDRSASRAVRRTILAIEAHLDNNLVARREMEEQQQQLLLQLFQRVLREAG
ncbi:MAG: hypothetical protein AAFV53_09040 [Myxococcota bacterium]